MNRNNSSTFLETNDQFSMTSSTTMLKSCKHGYEFIIIFTIVIKRTPFKKSLRLSTSTPAQFWAFFAVGFYTSLLGFSNISYVLWMCIVMKAHMRACISKYISLRNSSKCLNISSMMYQNGPIFSCGLLTIRMSQAFLSWVALDIVAQTAKIATAYPQIAPHIWFSPWNLLEKTERGKTINMTLGSK